MADTTRSRRTAGLTLALGLVLGGANESAAAPPVDFLRDVMPVLQKHCLSCHGPTKQKSGLRLDRKAAALKGGSGHGPAIVAGKSAESPLVRFAAGLDDELVMPPNDDNVRTLSDAEVATLRAWVDAGAPWPEPSVTTDDDPTARWAFAPLTRPDAPAEPGTEYGPVRNPIDAFLAARLRAKGLKPAAEADRRTLIRRLTFDLTGLPPTPEEVEAFERDPAPHAYERLVDRLLASPHLGERFARLWLDVAHYGESHGFGMDRPRQNAWPYRDYLVAAFNADTPYARFVQEQIAADALFPNRPETTPALGFAAAGPFNQSALAEQVDGTDCKRIALNLDRDDMVASVASTFLSLTVHCARCHDHKFDPIPQADYYRLQAVFAGVGRAERTFDADPAVAARRKVLTLEQEALARNPELPPVSADEARRLDDDRRAWEARVRHDLRGWTLLNPSILAAANGTTRVRQADGSYLATGSSPATETDTLTLADLPPGTTALRLELLPDPSLPGKGPGRADNGNVHITEIKAFALDGGDPAPVALKDPTADFSQPDWEVAKAFDGNASTGWGIHPEEGKPHAAVFALAKPWDGGSSAVLRLVVEQQHGRRHTLGRFRLWAYSRPDPSRFPALPSDALAALGVPESARTPAQKLLLSRHHRRLDLDARLAALPKPGRVFAIAGEFPAFRNYKPVSEPVPIRVLRRGDLKQPLDPVSPGALSAVRATTAEFSLPDLKDEKARRAAFARWLTEGANPLTWRSAVNRVWQWHFGAGLVATPNDFGRHGARPSHPELLDWLAATLRDNGSLKALHRLIVTSDAYRRSSVAAGTSDDTDNRLLARMNLLRLDAEQLRDALLCISGRLDPAMGGPSAVQFVLNDPNKEVAPQIDYASFDPDTPASSRRGVYRFLFRNINDPLLEAFDAADPSLSTPRRNVTITPQQSLALWNNRFVLRQCEHLAARLEREAPDLPSRLDRAGRLAWGRPLDADEARVLRAHAERHGLASACRLIVNAHDFVFIH
jgi:mono/diheme cytochrome c family protein